MKTMGTSTTLASADANAAAPAGAATVIYKSSTIDSADTDLESDVVIYHNPSSAYIPSKRWAARAAVLVTIIAIIVLGVAIGVSNKDGNVTKDPPVVKAAAPWDEAEPIIQQTTIEESPKVEAPKSAPPKPVPKPVPPKMNNNHLTTLSPSFGSTSTVSTDASSPPTGSGRGGDERRKMIQSPTWRG